MPRIPAVCVADLSSFQLNVTPNIMRFLEGDSTHIQSFKRAKIPDKQDYLHAVLLYLKPFTMVNVIFQRKINTVLS